MPAHPTPSGPGRGMGFQSADKEREKNMSDAVASYNKTNSEKLKEALALLPARDLPRESLKPFTYFRVLDSMRGAFLAVEHYHDEYADKPSDGISTFGHYFHSGVIAPDGSVLMANSIYEWRAVIMEYHAGWYITILEGLGHRMPDFKVSPECWGSTIAGIHDDRLRSEMCRQAVAGGIRDGMTYIDLLTAAHAVHRGDALRKPHFNEPSIVRFTI